MPVPCTRLVAVSILVLISVTDARAESANYYPPLFDIKTQFDPNSLTSDSNGQHLLAFPQSSPPYVQPSGRFRVLLPAGTTRVDLIFFAAQVLHVGMAVRYTIPPQCDYSQLTVDSWNCFPWDRDAKGTLSKLKLGRVVPGRVGRSSRLPSLKPTTMKGPARPTAVTPTSVG